MNPVRRALDEADVGVGIGGGLPDRVVGEERRAHVDQPSAHGGVGGQGDAMTAVATREATLAAEPTHHGIARVTKSQWFSPAAAVVMFLVALFFIPAFFDSFWIANFTQMAVFSIVAASAGLLYGRVGLVSLGQVASYGIGCWVTIRLSFGTPWPFPIIVIIGGLAAVLVGVLIGLPALRVSGLYLALVTLMLAAGMRHGRFTRCRKTW